MIKKNRLGAFVRRRVENELYQAFIPPLLPPDPPIALQIVIPHLEKAIFALSSLKHCLHEFPDTALLTEIFTKKEAVSCAHEHVEPQNHTAGLVYGFESMNNGRLLSLKLLKDVHALVLPELATKEHEVRATQIWIGGTRLGNALFIPPAPDLLPGILSNFEKFLYKSHETLPVLLQAGVLQAYFMMLLPFTTGNEVISTMVPLFFLHKQGLLDIPALPLSSYFAHHKNMYIRLLHEVRTHGAFETWLEFFLNSVTTVAQDTVDKVQQLQELFRCDKESIQILGRARLSCLKIFKLLQTTPQVTVPFVAQKLDITQPTVRAALHNLLTLGIVQEISKRQRDKVYVYKKYVDIIQ